MRNREDIRSVALPVLEWDEKGAADSLAKIVTHSCERADEAVAWYLRTKEVKRVWARILRLGAILFAAASGVLPILQQIFTASDGKPPSPQPGHQFSCP